MARTNVEYFKLNISYREWKLVRIIPANGSCSKLLVLMLQPQRQNKCVGDKQVEELN